MANKDADQVQRIMSSLKVSETEAREIMEYDRKVDKAKDGEVLPYDLTAEQNEVARKFAHTGTRKAPTAYKLTKRELKPNATKAGIIAELFQLIGEKSEFSVENVSILNKERQISFQIGDETYELTLVQKRRKKN